MAPEFNHTIILARDREASATFLADVLGFADPVPYGPFLTLQASNNVSLDVLRTDEQIVQQHYAFLATEAEFDEIFERIVAGNIQYWADPFFRMPGAINNHDGGRGVYFKDPSGHSIEVITKPYF